MLKVILKLCFWFSPCVCVCVYRYVVEKVSGTRANGNAYASREHFGWFSGKANAQYIISRFASDATFPFTVFHQALNQFKSIFQMDYSFLLLFLFISVVSFFVRNIKWYIHTHTTVYGYACVSNVGNFFFLVFALIDLFCAL